MKILGIDTSCDETAAAIVVDGRDVQSNIVASQIKAHEEYGGVVPELASRKHIEAINYIVNRAIAEADTTFDDIDAVAVTNRPGLIGALLIGVAAAKSLAYCHNLPLLGINHIEGHIYANYMVHDNLTFPHICLTVSGGHTLLVEVHEGWKYKVLGTTQDDAAGEVYDKVAKYLGLGFPGGKDHRRPCDRKVIRRPLTFRAQCSAAEIINSVLAVSRPRCDILWKRQNALEQLIVEKLPLKTLRQVSKQQSSTYL